MFFDIQSETSFKQFLVICTVRPPASGADSIGCGGRTMFHESLQYWSHKVNNISAPSCISSPLQAMNATPN